MKEHLESVEERRGEETMAGMTNQLFLQRPRTCAAEDGSRFTTYEIVIETDHIAFSLPKSSVRRRFSEFSWLRSQLAENYPERTPPSLPPKTFFTSRFDPDVIETRKTGLQTFLISLLEEPIYLSDGLVHLFLQTSLPVSDIEACVEGQTGKSVQDTVLDHASLYNGGDNDSGIMTCSCDSTASEPRLCSDCSHVPATLQHYPRLTSHDIFSPTALHSVPFPRSVCSKGSDISDSAASCLCSQCQGQKITVSRSPMMSSTPLEICRNSDCRCNSGGLSDVASSVMSIDAPSEGSSTNGDDSNSSGLECLSSLEGSSHETHRDSDQCNKKKKVTFSPEVTVAKILDTV